MRDALPNASFIGFTGTPIEREDANTKAVFGNYVDVYDIQQAVEDGATVPIYYESRLAKIQLSEADQQILDQQVEEITEDDELTDRQRQFARWTSKEAVVGSESRLKQIAADLIGHFEQRLAAAAGKGMIVCMSRCICVALHNEIIKRRPDWYDAADDKGVIKIVMTGSASDPLDWQEHIRNKPRRKAIGDRLKDPTDPLKLVIVRDMLLTGCDAPVLHTMYIDKPMNGHNLMQAIARVNRVFGDKEGGLIVDYIGIAQDLKNALADNPTAEAVLGDQTLKLIAHELVESVRKNTSIDWQLKQSVQAKLRVLVKRILRKYKYPPDDPGTGEYTISVNKVLDQAELLADFWSAGE